MGCGPALELSPGSPEVTVCKAASGRRERRPGQSSEVSEVGNIQCCKCFNMVSSGVTVPVI